MTYKKFDRSKLTIRPLSERKNQISIEKSVVPLTAKSAVLKKEVKELIIKTADKIRIARDKNRSVIIAFGAHTIKNGLGQILIELIKRGWVTHLATN